MNLNIVPKIGEDATEIRIIDKFVENKLEMQLLTNNIKDFNKKIEAFLKTKKLDQLIVHLPMEIADWESIPVNKEIETDFLMFVRDCATLSNKYNTEIYILGHMSLRYEVIKHIKMKEWFCHILRMTSEDKIFFLVENPTSEPYKAKSGEPFLRFVRDVNHPRVKCCFDLCHYTVGHVLLGDAYKMPEDLGKYTFSVHFSDLPIKKHLFEPNTHGRCHKTKEDILRDLEILKNMGIDLNTVNIVTEINENNYKEKPDLIHELQLLTEITKGE